MRVHVHTKFCFLCVLTFLLQCVHCQHQGDHHGDHHGHHHGDHHGDHHGNGHAHKDIQISETPYVGGATTLAAGASADTTLDMLAEEQRFYIQQLFRRYGTQDRLDFLGFQSLLVSLGLGEVKVVGGGHEELGHDHVAHLDILDVQEGLHTHLPTEDHNKAGHHHPHVKPAITKCSKPGGGGNASLTADRDAPQDHNHTHNREEDPEHIHEVQHKHSEGSHKGHTHNHDHKHGHGHSHHKGHTHAAVVVVPVDGETASPPHDHEHDHDHPQQTQSTSKASSAHPEQLPTPRTEIPIVTQQQRPEAAPLESEPLTSMTESQTRSPRKPAKERGQRGRNKTSSSSSSSSPPHSLANRRRREAPTSSTPALPDHLGGVAHQHKEYYGLTPDSKISQVQFTYLCPALLYQIDSRVCIRHSRCQLEVEQKEVEAVFSECMSFPKRHTDNGWVWLWGFVSITIISLLSLLGVVLVPILNQSCFKFLLTFLVALAVGTLSGDALLHLLPHGTFCVRRSRRGVEAKIGRKLSDHKLNRRSDAEWLNLKHLDQGLADGSVPAAISCDNGHNDTQLTDLQSPESPGATTPLATPKEGGANKGKKRHGHSHGHSHGGNCHTDQEMKDAGIASIAWMAPPSAPTSPEGSARDFAVLLKAGMSVKQAIAYNLLSALMAYVGMAIGTAVGQYAHNVTSWIFAVTAGMFLYVALVDMGTLRCY
ncbi:hypothetical protein CRUP_011866 [Coryphaenoides rupestris]|nr:hypothetical protein CRUP_011866 [Coryphaenoides rupestris]